MAMVHVCSTTYPHLASPRCRRYASEMFEQETAGVMVRAEPQFLPAESSPEQRRFVWAYTIEIENRTAQSLQLVSRYWRITDQNGVVQEVRGEGVIGQQPVIAPGDSFRYTSAAPLTAESGLMSGAYVMRGVSDDVSFDVSVPTFPLDPPQDARLAN